MQLDSRHKFVDPPALHAAVIQRSEAAMIRPSLRTKMTIIFPVSICLAIFVMLYGAYCYYVATTKETVAIQQELTLQILADDIDHKLYSTHQQLIHFGQRISAKNVFSAQQVMESLKDRGELLNVFDNGIFLFDKDGRMLLELPLGNLRRGKDYSYRDYLKVTISTKLPYISDPYTSSQSHGHPAIVMTVPLLDSKGNIRSILCGSVDLTRNNFLGNISSRSIGKSGYMFLFDTNRLMIVHPDPDRVMKSDIPAGKNRLLDRAIDGYDGTDETVNSRGLRSLTSFKRLKSKNWILGANFPVVEAYKPIAKLKLFFSVIILPAMLFLFYVMHRLLLRMTNPLLNFTRHIEMLPTKTGKDRLYQNLENTEFAALEATFNNLITMLDSQQEETAKKELLYRTVTRFSSDIVFWISPESTVLHFISPDCDRICGYSQNEFYEDPDLLNRLIHPDFRAVWNESVAGSEGGSSVKQVEGLELVIVSRSGERVWVSHDRRPVWGDSGEYMGVRGSFRDITAHKNSDILLSRQNEYLRTLHDTTLGLIGRLDLHSLLSAIITRAGTLMETEHGFIYLMDADKETMVMRVKYGSFEYLEHHPLRRGEGLAGYVWEKGELFATRDYSLWSGRLDDQQRSVIKAAVGIPLMSGGEVVGVIGLAYINNELYFDESKIQLLQQFAELASMALDNARLYEDAQKELAERAKVEERLRQITYAVEQSPASILITDLEGNIEYANPYVTRITGYELNELLGRKASILKSGLTGQEVYRQLWETILVGGEWRGEFQNRKKNGNLYWEMALIAPVRNAKGVITNFMAIKEDISERKILENQLCHSQKMEAIGQLAGGIAHDFNNILTAIIGYASLMQLKLPEDSSFRTTASQILASAERGSSLTQGLLAFSRKQVSNPDRINLNVVIERLAKIMMRMLGKEIQVEFMLESLPLIVMADSTQLEQVLMNLTTNARDAMPDGGKMVVKTELITIDAAFIASQGVGAIGDYAMLTVLDTGEGIDSESAKRIFEPFYTTKETGKGSGLGLSIVYGIIKKYNGYIACNSDSGKGTTFSIYLPLIKASLEGTVPVEVEPVSDEGRKVILFAAPEEICGQTVTLLEEFGYTLIIAQTYADLVSLAQENMARISLVMIDDGLPDSGGVNLMAEFGTSFPALPLLYCGNPGLAKGLAEGADSQNRHVIAKPFVPKELLMKIGEVLRDAI